MQLTEKQGNKLLLTMRGLTKSINELKGILAQNKEILTIEEAKHFLGIPLSALEKLRDDGAIKTVLVENKPRFARTELEKFKKQHFAA